VWSDYDGDTIYGDYTVDEETGAVTALASYLPGIGQVDEATGAVYYHHADHLGSARVVTSAGGGVVERIVHTAFGEPVTRLGIAPTPTRYLYAGAWGYESDLGADHAGGAPGDDALPYQHLGYRWYSPSSGRILQRDPIGIFGGLNVYGYVRASPTMLVDPFGYWSWRDHRWESDSVKDLRNNKVYVHYYKVYRVRNLFWTSEVYVYDHTDVSTIYVKCAADDPSGLDKDIVDAIKQHQSGLISGISRARNIAGEFAETSAESGLADTDPTQAIVRNASGL